MKNSILDFFGNSIKSICEWCEREETQEVPFAYDDICVDCNQMDHC